jgi:ElaA protein
MTESLLWRAFEALTVHELYALLRLRTDVFVVEQNCVFGDIDGKDPVALHLLASEGDRLGGYLRVFPPGTAGPVAKIGRVVVAPAFRATGLGRRLMREALDEIARRCGPVPVELAAQAHLEGFYGSFGFARLAPGLPGRRHPPLRHAAVPYRRLNNLPFQRVTPKLQVAHPLRCFAAPVYRRLHQSGLKSRLGEVAQHGASCHLARRSGRTRGRIDRCGDRADGTRRRRDHQQQDEFAARRNHRDGGEADRGCPQGPAQRLGAERQRYRDPAHR